MSWATAAIAKLQAGESVTIYPRGNSMTPLINSGDEVHLEPLGGILPEKDDIVLVHVNGSDYLHLIKSVRTENGNIRYQIGNNHGRINGWVGIDKIYGKKV